MTWGQWRLLSYKGKTCGLTEVKVSDFVIMTTDTKDGKTVATKIEAKKASSEATLIDHSPCGQKRSRFSASNEGGAVHITMSKRYGETPV